MRQSLSRQLFRKRARGDRGYMRLCQSARATDNAIAAQDANAILLVDMFLLFDRAAGFPPPRSGMPAR